MLGEGMGRASRAVESVIGHHERIGIDQSIQTSPGRAVLQLAVGEAGQAGAGRAGTEHLLPDLLAEGEGLPGPPLSGLGAPLDRFAAAIGGASEGG